MRYHRIEIEPRDLEPSNDPEKDTVRLGFTIQPPLKRILDPEFIDKAAQRLHGVDINRVTLGYSDKTSSYGSFETCAGDVIRRRDEIMKDAQLVFGAALGTTIEVVFPTEQ